MKRRLTLWLLPPLILSACSCRTTPTPMVSFQLSAPLTYAPTPQGVTLGGPDQHFEVAVRDARNRPVTFQGTTYDPTGQGASTIVLNTGNNFERTVVLPQGTYSFETRVQDDQGDTVLLGYGPAAENTTALTTANSVVRLVTHAVIDPASSALVPDRDLGTLPTGTTFNLKLQARASAALPVGGGSPINGAVPTSDLGAVTYTLGNPTDGVLNGAGSKVGVNVTAQGNDTDHELNVTATFTAWVRDGAAETASQQPVTLTFAHDIEQPVP